MPSLPRAAASWCEQIERLSGYASPCRYLLLAKWAAMRTNALTFLDHHGAEARWLGQTVPLLSDAHKGIPAWMPKDCLTSGGAAPAVLSAAVLSNAGVSSQASRR